VISSQPQKAAYSPVHPAGVVLALLATVWHAALMTSATNDNFLHMTLAQQWLAGDWPVRDFFDHAWVLQYALSAAALIVGGDRLIGEALIVGITWGLSTYVVFRVVRELTGSVTIAALSATLLIVASARGYSYPKGVVYAVAAMFWWQYVRNPTTARLVSFGAWAAVAFYWRPDHGVYVAVALTLAVVAADGFRLASLGRCALAGAVMLGLVAPFLVYVQLVVGLPAYGQTAVVQAQVEHLSHGTHQWPLLRFGSNLFTVEPAEKYAPTVTLRWSAASSPAERQQIVARYGLTPVDNESEDSGRVRLSDRSLPAIRALINEPAIEDTAGIDRSTATLPSSSWSAYEQWAFRNAWLRVRLLPQLDDQGRATELAVALFHLLPIFALVAASWIARQLPGRIKARELVAFAVFAFLIDLAMLRDPFPARMADAVVLSAIVLGICVAALWQSAAVGGTAPRAVIRAAALALAFTSLTTVATAARFTDRISNFTGHWRSLPAARAAWQGTYDELVASPPLAFYVNQSARFTLRLAAYVRECVPPSGRLLVLWFEPEIYYYSHRLMAQRHLGFAPAWAALDHEQQMTLEKLTRYTPPVALARRSALETYARATFPGVVDVVEREYERAAIIEDAGEEYWIFTRRDRPPLRGFGPDRWPCYVRDDSPWSRVGVAGE
jgi:hypothetical protein